MSVDEDTMIPEDQEPEIKDEVAPPEDDEPGEPEDNEPGDDGREALLARAKEYGISEEDLETYGDKAEEIVDRFAQSIDAKIAEIGKALVQKGGEEEPEKEEEPGEPEEPGTVSEKLKQAGYDDDLVSVVSALEAEIGNLKAQVESTQQNDTEQIAEQLNDFFANPPERFKDVVSEMLGGKSINEVEEGSEERKFVDSVIDEMDALHAGYLAQGKELSLKEVGERALALVCKDKLKELAEREIAGKLKRRSDSTLNRPRRSGQDTKAPTTHEEEVAMVAEAMKEHGFIKQSLSDFLA